MALIRIREVEGRDRVIYKCTSCTYELRMTREMDAAFQAGGPCPVECVECKRKDDPHLETLKPLLDQ